MFAAIPCDPLHELHRNSPDDRPLVRLAQRPELQHNSEPIGWPPLRPRMEQWDVVFLLVGREGVPKCAAGGGDIAAELARGSGVSGTATRKEPHVMTFEVGALLEDENWQAPVYCFSKQQNSEEVKQEQPNFIKGAFQKRLIDGARWGSMTL
ncbi:hypothetical protein Pint_25489 [Pistacia integerrima]|uniref:Uncharacterized protein n=1 Tax=Pistacia integerrima TaxID=434235 RepID=A0ACC0YGM7_9ROSI|nr:hypothetical protein Pint_25489 [Pistacia integerrima]